MIPADFFVMVNVWYVSSTQEIREWCTHFLDFKAILHGDRTYTDPLEFEPERFLGSNLEPDLTTV